MVETVEMMEMGPSGPSQSFEMGRFSYRSIVSSKLKRSHMLMRGNFFFPQCGFFFSVFSGRALSFGSFHLPHQKCFRVLLLENDI